MLKDIMLESEMEEYLTSHAYEVTDSEGCIDSTKVVDEAIELGYDSYMLDGNGVLNQTLVFIKG